MSEAVIVAVISGCLSLSGVVITSLATSHKQEKAQAVAQAVTDTQLDELTREVRAHNGFAEKVPTLQGECNELKRRVDRLEKYHMQQN